MAAFPNSPRVLKGGIVLLDPDQFTVLPNGIIVLQYNPDTLTRTLKIKGAEEGGDRSEALRLTGPPVETIKLDAEIDATDQVFEGVQQFGLMVTEFQHIFPDVHCTAVYGNHGRVGIKGENRLYTNWDRVAYKFMERETRTQEHITWNIPKAKPSPPMIVTAGIPSSL